MCTFGEDAAFKDMVVVSLLQEKVYCMYGGIIISRKVCYYFKNSVLQKCVEKMLCSIKWWYYYFRKDVRELKRLLQVQPMWQLIRDLLPQESFPVSQGSANNVPAVYFAYKKLQERYMKGVYNLFIYSLPVQFFFILAYNINFCLFTINNRYN